MPEFDIVHVHLRFACLRGTRTICSLGNIYLVSSIARVRLERLLKKAEHLLSETRLLNNNSFSKVHRMKSQNIIFMTFPRDQISH